MKIRWRLRNSYLRKGSSGLLALLAVGGLLLGACTIDPSQLSGSALRDTIFLPLVSSSNSATSQTAPQNGDIIPGQYIVVFKEDQVLASSVSAVATEMATQYNGEVIENYETALSGFTVHFPPETDAAALAALQQDSRVAYVEPDEIITLDATEMFTATVTEANAAAGGEVGAAAVEATQANAPWGLDRIDQRALPLNNTYSYASTGSGVRAYVIGTGIRLTHSEFGGRAIRGINTTYDTNDNDCHGHGTHMAALIGGATYGVAKGATLISVKVYNCYGVATATSILAGINWVAGQRAAYPLAPLVANMGGGGNHNPPINDAVRKVVQNGITFVAAAGNSNASACGFSPSAAPEAITVGATTNTDSRASYSNYGTCLDLFAPGDATLSAWATSDTATNTQSSTAVASAYVTGAVARYLQRDRTFTPLQLRNELVNSATPDVVVNSSSSSDRLLYIGPTQ